MEIRKASVQDLGQIMQVYDKARKFMRENGNAEQWGEDYPSAELIEHDIYACQKGGLPVFSIMRRKKMKIIKKLMENG